jgi:hypothetical protein
VLVTIHLHTSPSHPVEPLLPAPRQGHSP